MVNASETALSRKNPRFSFSSWTILSASNVAFMPEFALHSEIARLIRNVIPSVVPPRADTRRICSPRTSIESSKVANGEPLQEVLLEQLRDILHAEKQLVKALPKMVKAARAAKLQQMFEIHLDETQAHVERLNECFNLMGVPAKTKPCKGMMGLLEEGQEIMKEGERKDEFQPTSS